MSCHRSGWAERTCQSVGWCGLPQGYPSVPEVWKNHQASIKDLLSHKLRNEFLKGIAEWNTFAVSWAVHFFLFPTAYSCCTFPIYCFFFFCCGCVNHELEGLYSISLPFELHCSCGIRSSTPSGSNLQHHGTWKNYHTHTKSTSRSNSTWHGAKYI